ncbi:MAG: hypothetical protein WBA97_23470, partial [Actinophytocola sp.]|uniref:hypothetical protein n=1 Tax=Actinophytocola sp. TaxID=1872138 RepID=UPI003C724626
MPPHARRDLVVRPGLAPHQGGQRLLADSLPLGRLLADNLLVDRVCPRGRPHRPHRGDLPVPAGPALPAAQGRV